MVNCVIDVYKRQDQNWKAIGITEIRVVFPGDPSIEGTTLRPQAVDQ